MRIAILPLAVAVALLATGCENPNPTIGATLDDHGRLVILYEPCKAGARVFSVRVSKSGSTLWETSSAEGTVGRRFVLGEETPGLTTAGGPVSADLGQVRVSIRSTELADDWETVDLRKVEGSRVLVPRRGSMTMDEFAARNTCD